jgi:hypothetical protein
LLVACQIGKQYFDMYERSVLIIAGKENLFSMAETSVDGCLPVCFWKLTFPSRVRRNAMIQNKLDVVMFHFQAISTPEHAYGYFGPELSFALL